MRKPLSKIGFSFTVLLALLTACGDAEPPPTAATEPSTSIVPSPAQAESEDVAPATEAESAALRERVAEAVTPPREWTAERTRADAGHIAQTLERAALAAAEGRIEEANEGALALYLSVLDTEPDNAEARQGIDLLIASLRQRAGLALMQGRFDDAAHLAEVLDAVVPDDAVVADIRRKAQTGREVDHLLAEGRRLIGAGQQISPRGNNALNVYREALRIDPGNARVEAALSELERYFLDAALSAAQARDWDDADRRLRQASRVLAASPAQQNTAARIVELRHEHAARLLQQADTALLQRDADAAERVLEQLEALGAQTEGIDPLRSRIENLRLYGGRRPGQVFSDRLDSGEPGPDMVVIPAGGFRMGSPRDESGRQGNEGPLHSVRFERGFAAGRSEVTLAQFRAFVRASGYRPTSRSRRGSTVYDENSGSMVERGSATWESDYTGKRADSDDLPVIHVAWHDAQAYAQWLASETGQGYRLLSETEFEYLLRAGSQTRYPWGDGEPPRVLGNLTGDGDRSPSQRHWANAFKSYSDGHWGPAPVATFEANAFGLHDLVGNVSEWVDDCWHDSYQRAPTDGSAWINPGCKQRVIRGASWASSPEEVRSAYRIRANPDTTNARVGFRVARTL